MVACKLFQSGRVENLWFGKGLTLSQTTNFRLFQTQRFCRPQFQSKWQNIFQTENTVEKGEIAGYEQFLLFPQSSEKAFTADM